MTILPENIPLTINQAADKLECNIEQLFQCGKNGDVIFLWPVTNTTDDEFVKLDPSDLLLRSEIRQKSWDKEYKHFFITVGKENYPDVNFDGNSFKVLDMDDIRIDSESVNNIVNSDEIKPTSNFSEHYIPPSSGQFYKKDILCAYFKISSIEKSKDAADTAIHIATYKKQMGEEVHDEVQELLELLNDDELGIGEPKNGFWYKKLQTYQWFKKVKKAGHKYECPGCFIPKRILGHSSRNDKEDINKQGESKQNTKLSYQNSHVLIAATLVYLGRPKKTDYSKLKDSLEEVDEKYGLDIFGDKDDKQLTYYPKRSKNGEAEIFKFGNKNRNISSAITAINKEFQDYINKITELSTNLKEFERDLGKINTL